MNTKMIIFEKLENQIIDFIDIGISLSLQIGSIGSGNELCNQDHGYTIDIFGEWRIQKNDNILSSSISDHKESYEILKLLFNKKINKIQLQKETNELIITVGEFKLMTFSLYKKQRWSIFDYKKQKIHSICQDKTS